MNKRSLLAAPYIIWIIGFTVLPVFMIVFYALRDGSGGFTLGNILAIFQPVHLKSLLLALWLAVVCTVICLLLAYPLAVILRKLDIGRQGMMAIIVILPMWVNFVLRIMAWQLLLSRNGIINGFLGALGIPGQDLANSSAAIVIGMVYDYLPFMILPVYNAVSELREDIIEAARDLGAPPTCSAYKDNDTPHKTGNHQRHNHGVRAVTDYIRHPGYTGWRQSDADRQYNRTGILYQHELESGIRAFNSAYDIRTHKYDVHCR